MCTPAKLFSISIIIIENNFAGVHMSFRIPSDRTIRHVPSSLECTEYSTVLIRSTPSTVRTVLVRTVRLHVNTTSRTQNVLTT